MKQLEFSVNIKICTSTKKTRNAWHGTVCSPHGIAVMPPSEWLKQNWVLIHVHVILHGQAERC